MPRALSLELRAHGKLVLGSRGGVAKLALFGSIAQATARQDSDGGILACIVQDDIPPLLSTHHTLHRLE